MKHSLFRGRTVESRDSRYSSSASASFVNLRARPRCKAMAVSLEGGGCIKNFAAIVERKDNLRASFAAKRIYETIKPLPIVIRPRKPRGTRSTMIAHREYGILQKTFRKIPAI